MARPLRVEYPGAAYHVLSRGVGRRKIFHYDSDYETFLAKLEENAEAFKVQVRSYCLYCRGRYTLAELSERMNISLGGLTSGRYAFKQRSKDSSALRKQVRPVERQLNA